MEVPSTCIPAAAKSQNCCCRLRLPLASLYCSWSIPGTYTATAYTHLGVQLHQHRCRAAMTLVQPSNYYATTSATTNGHCLSRPPTLTHSCTRAGVCAAMTLVQPSAIWLRQMSAAWRWRQSGDSSSGGSAAPAGGGGRAGGCQHVPACLPSQAPALPLVQLLTAVRYPAQQGPSPPKSPFFPCTLPPHPSSGAEEGW